VTFASAFVQTPEIMIIPPLADTGTYTVTTPTKSGFTITVAGSVLVSQDVDVVFFAHEKL